MLKNKLPKRKNDTNKGDYGRVLIVAGSSGMLGAGVLASRAALRAGAGLVYWAVPSSLKDIANLATPEVIIKNYYEMSDIKYDCIACGPGLSQSENIKDLVLKLLKTSNCPLIIDADALNVLNGDDLEKTNLQIIITPHPGEMARLANLSIDYIQKNRLKIAKEFSKKWNAIIVLKGYNTVVASPFGLEYVNKTGNPGMATAGSGDVLTGIIASFVGQGLPIFDAVCLAVNIHGIAGDLSKKDKGEYGMIASDIIENIPYAIRAYNGK
ncbi:NAD(P)H-hydrate dehydratase [Candidatus Saganbacteria bacterium]|nr:NAD(P)H-hydrate dehydratase [Candidatus Saganbacteria bacterium]